MKVWLALAGLVCVVGGQYTGRHYDETHAASAQYRVVEPAQHSGSDNDHVSSAISHLVTHPTAFPLVVSPAHAVPHSPLVSAGGVALPTHVHAEQYDPNPRYTYSYGVHDPSNGDVKGHSETRQGDVVSGSYSVMEADGTMRIVEYTADAIHGFNAVVRNTPIQAQDYVQTSIPQHTNAVFPQRTHPAYLYRQASVYPSASVSHNPQSAYAPSAQLVSPSNEISYVITYQTPSSVNSPQYTLEQSNNAFTLQQSVAPSHTLSQSDAHNDHVRTTPQTHLNQQGSYYHFRMSSNSQQSTDSQQQLSTHQPQINQSQNTNRSSMSNRQSIINHNSLPFANQRNMIDNQRSSSTADYQRSHPTVTAYPTATPAYRY